MKDITGKLLEIGDRVAVYVSKEGLGLGFVASFTPKMVSVVKEDRNNPGTVKTWGTGKSDRYTLKYGSDCAIIEKQVITDHSLLQ
jgi:hypothetical protein